MRIYKSNNEVVDFCMDCFPDETTAYKKFANVGEGPDDRGNCYTYDADHPPYEYENYRCEECGDLLNHNDNSWLIK